MSIFRALRGACLADYLRKPLGGPLVDYEETLLILSYHQQTASFRPCMRLPRVFTREIRRSTEPTRPPGAS